MGPVEVVDPVGRVVVGRVAVPGAVGRRDAVVHGPGGAAGGRLGLGPEVDEDGEDVLLALDGVVDVAGLPPLRSWQSTLMTRLPLIVVVVASPRDQLPDGVLGELWPAASPRVFGKLSGRGSPARGRRSAALRLPAKPEPASAAARPETTSAPTARPDAALQWRLFTDPPESGPRSVPVDWRDRLVGGRPVTSSPGLTGRGHASVWTWSRNGKGAERRRAGARRGRTAVRRASRQGHELINGAAASFAGSPRARDSSGHAPPSPRFSRVSAPNPSTEEGDRA